MLREGSVKKKRFGKNRISGCVGKIGNELVRAEEKGRELKTHFWEGKKVFIGGSSGGEKRSIWRSLCLKKPVKNKGCWTLLPIGGHFTWGGGAWNVVNRNRWGSPEKWIGREKLGNFLWTKRSGAIKCERETAWNGFLGRLLKLEITKAM